MTAHGQDIAATIGDGALAHLSERDKRAVLLAMAGAAERAYRRGAQQALTIREKRPEALPADLHRWRYSIPVVRAPWLDERGNPQTSLDRLEMEEQGALVRLGLLP